MNGKGRGSVKEIASGTEKRLLSPVERTALAFVDEYPLTRFAPDVFTGDGPFVRAGTSFTVLYIGYGEVNQSLLFASDTTERFFTSQEGELRPLLVRRYVFGDAKTRREFAYDVRFDALREKKDEYLPLPLPPSDVTFAKNGVGEDGFWAEAEQAIGSGVTYVLIAGEDAGKDEEIAAAFAKRYEKKNDVRVFLYAPTAPEGVIAFGFDGCGEETSVLEEMARSRHELHASDGKADAWEKLPTEKKRANVFACASIRNKLRFLGFDRAPETDERAGASAAFARAYEKDDPIRYENEAGVFRVAYDVEFRHGTVREAFAVHEHDRWNAYTFRTGFLPATKEEILKKTKGELSSERKHANLTTFEGLLTYRKMAAEAKGTSEAEEDVIKYDYRLMDEAAALLKSVGYKIVKG